MFRGTSCILTDTNPKQREAKTLDVFISTKLEIIWKKYISKVSSKKIWIWNIEIICWKIETLSVPTFMALTHIFNPSHFQPIASHFQAFHFYPHILTNSLIVGIF